MDLKEIAAVSGKPGLFKILKPTRTGVVLESLDEAKNKLIINSNTKVSILKDISIYTLTKEGNIPLADILMKVKELYNNSLPVTVKSSDKELKDFFVKVLPEYDTEKVYVSDIKKLVSWYNILTTYQPDLFKAETSEAGGISAEGEVVSDKETKKPKKQAKTEVTEEKGEAVAPAEGKSKPAPKKAAASAEKSEPKTKKAVK